MWGSIPKRVRAGKAANALAWSILDAFGRRCHIAGANRCLPAERRNMATAITHVITWLRGELVGTDEFGNRYYQERRAPRGRRRRRWVVYEGEDEASRVPPEWHAWLHYTVDEVPSGKLRRRPWQKPHRPNLTGTRDAYLPPGHILKGGRRARATGDYEPWTPN